MTASTTKEVLANISKEAKLLSDCAWLAAIATDPEAEQTGLELTINQWENLQCVMTAIVPEVKP